MKPKTWVLKVLSYEVWVEYDNDEAEVAEWYYEEEAGAAWGLYKHLCDNPPCHAVRVSLEHHRKVIASCEVEG